MRLFAPDFPFRPDRSPFFYGWAIAAVSTLAFLMSIPGQTMGVSVFTDALIGATGLSRVEISNAYLVGTLLSGAMLPMAGAWLDRYGARPTIVAASVLLGLTLVYLSRVDDVAAGLASATALAAGWSAFGTLIFGFFLLRFSGQGVLTLVGRTLIGRWFDRYRGIVTGLQGPFIAFGFSFAPVLLQLWIDASTWRGAWVEMAIVVGVGMSFTGWLIYRDSPEACGLAMDGRPIPAASEAGVQKPAAAEPEYTREEARRRLIFWAFTFGFAFQGLSITGITFHILDIGVEANLTATEVLSIWPKNAVVSVVTSITVGWLTGHISLRVLLVYMMVSQSIGVFSAAHLGDPFFYACAVVGLGTSGGCFGALSTVSFPRYFGRKHLGSINSEFLRWTVWGSALGPSVLAVSRQYVGSYELALQICAALPLAVIAMVLIARTPPVEARR